MLKTLWQKFAIADPDTKDAPDTPGEGLVLLDDLRAVTFCGADVLSFLQGYFTCDCEQLSSTLQATAICNLRGRVVAHGWCYLSAQNSVTWLIHHSLVENLAQFMTPYLAFSKTQLIVDAEDRLILGCLSENSSTNEIAPGLSIHVFADDAELQHALSGRQPVPRTQWDGALIARKIPWLSSENSGRFLPQMLGLLALGAIDFEKGCYLGQEVVARAQHLGKVKRSLQGLQWAGAVPPEIGGDVSSTAGKTAGSIIQVANEASVCLAVLQTDTALPVYQAETELRSL